MKIFMCDDILLRCERERERERKKQSLIIVTPLLLLNVVVIFFVVFVLCVNFYLLQIKKAENKLVRVSVAYFIVLLRGQLQKRQSVQLDASTVIGQFGAQLAHRDASVLF